MVLVDTSFENNLLLLHNDKDYDYIAKVLPELRFYSKFTNLKVISNLIPTMSSYVNGEKLSGKNSIPADVGHL